jgi:hypothetical protein
MACADEKIGRGSEARELSEKDKDRMQRLRGRSGKAAIGLIPGTSETYLSSAGHVSGAGPMLSAIRFTRSGAVEAPA